MKERHKNQKILRALTKERKVYLEEMFMAPSEYPTAEELTFMINAPPFHLFPDGMFILGTRGFKRILGFSASSQIDQLQAEERADAAVNN